MCEKCNGEGIVIEPVSTWGVFIKPTEKFNWKKEVIDCCLFYGGAGVLFYLLIVIAYCWR